MKKQWMILFAMMATLFPAALPAAAAQPYQIGTAEELVAFAETVNGGEFAAGGVLTADIDLGGRTWTPIGINAMDSYQGTFDGQGHCIRGLLTDGVKSQQGLFSYLSGTVQNLTVYGQVGSTAYAGGITAYLNGGTIKNCGSYADVGAEGNYAGGIVGYNNKGTVDNCFNAGNIVGKGSVGGIVGGEQTRTAGTVRNCYNTGKITGSSTWVGGIIGQPKKGMVQNCYNTGTVSNPNGSFLGGIAGGPATAVFENCYYIKTAAAAGIGAADTGDAADTEAVVQKEPEEMKTEAFAAALDGAFAMDAQNQNGGYPIFKWQQGPEFSITYSQGVIRVTAPQAIAGTVYLGVYSGGVMQDIRRTNGELTPAGLEIPVSGLALGDSGLLRVFVWDGNLAPLCEVKTFTIDGGNLS